MFPAKRHILIFEILKLFPRLREFGQNPTKNRSIICDEYVKMFLLKFCAILKQKSKHQPKLMIKTITKKNFLKKSNFLMVI